ncbi:hypothetical protein [Diaphorobacter aerolatus]|uniref:Lipoprotein n=1 Tax=Diaphorobacter aerolatus TaxID=1288495 RepID=A0A7H0GMQ6_9BURK|nr:hypothetical protein [Diaphorobacter aerolatus]QNP49572.1 hypothetical protein H9K75_06240 [Diaphorobacter aerolatus]
MKLVPIVLLGTFISTAACAGDMTAFVKKVLGAEYILIEERALKMSPKSAPQFIVVATRRSDEPPRYAAEAPTRPLLLVEEKQGSYTVFARNDNVVGRLDGAAQCDPVLDMDEPRITQPQPNVFSFENTAACGQHWNYSVSFKYDRSKRQWYFYRSVFESYVLGDENSDALKLDTRSVTKADKKRMITFDKFNLH